MSSNYHYSVLLEETIDALHVKPDGIYVDMTTGRGGHSSLLLSKLDKGHLYCFDKDSSAISYCSELFKNDDRVSVIHSDFRYFKEELAKLNVTKVDGIMFDLGVSSPQFDNPERGFSYRFDARLDMRMDQNQSLDAYKVVNTYSLQELTRIFKDYGEEKFAYPIAKAIVNAREIAPVETTFQLVDLIRKGYSPKALRAKGHPAKKVFQALRVEVNDELGALKQGLEDAISLLNVGGVVAVISFQSLEDRIVKQTFNSFVKVDKGPSKLPLTSNQVKQADFELIHKNIIMASQEEQDENNRSHCAKLRAMRRVKL